MLLESQSQKVADAELESLDDQPLDDQPLGDQPLGGDLGDLAGDLDDQPLSGDLDDHDIRLNDVNG